MNPAPNIDWNLIRLLAARCELAYRESTISDARTDAQANVTQETINGEPVIIVAFRGSSNAKDFLQDAEFWMVDLNTNVRLSMSNSRPMCHHGFLEDFEAISVAVTTAVKNLLVQTPAAKVYLTGHSLGGALAILGALEFARQKLAVTLVTTFGQPRAGNAAFRELYNQAGPVAASLGAITFRVVNQNDIVPRLPGWLLNYRHCGQEIFLEPGTGWGVNPSLLYKMVCDALGLWGAYRNAQDVLISQHFIAAYQRRLQLL